MLEIGWGAWYVEGLGGGGTHHVQVAQLPIIKPCIIGIFHKPRVSVPINLARCDKPNPILHRMEINPLHDIFCNAKLFNEETLVVVGDD